MKITFKYIAIILFSVNSYSQFFEPDIEDIKNSAESNDIKSQIELAQRYKSGNEVELDLAKSFYWMLKAANQNNEEAAIDIAIMYSDGQGTPSNPAEAFKWFSKYPNNNKSILALGYFYLYGYGTKVNYKLALSNYQKSYNYVNSIASMEGLIHIYKNGLGVPVNMDKVALLETKIKEEKNYITQKNARLAGYEKHKTECDLIYAEINSEDIKIDSQNQTVYSAFEELDTMISQCNRLVKSLDSFNPRFYPNGNLYTGDGFDLEGYLNVRKKWLLKSREIDEYRVICENMKHEISQRIELQNEKKEKFNKDCNK